MWQTILLKCKRHIKLSFVYEVRKRCLEEQWLYLHLTDEQRKAALEKAAQARHARAELREKVKTGKVSLKEVLDSTDPIAERMKVSALIESRSWLWQGKGSEDYGRARNFRNSPR